METQCSKLSVSRAVYINLGTLVEGNRKKNCRRLQFWRDSTTIVGFMELRVGTIGELFLVFT